VVISLLDNARKYATEVKSKFTDVWYNDKYKYYFCNWHNEHDMDDNDWTNMYFVSTDKSGNVLGYISYSIDRSANYAHKFGAINFSDDKITFGKDLCQVIDDIFCKFNLQRMEFDVICGNPIEKTYDKMVAKYGGRVIGIRKRVATLMDNRLYDSKSYEILREDYLKSKQKNS
jgi:YHS domain-containing protein